MEIRTPPKTEAPQKFEIFPAPSYTAWKKNCPPQKNICGNGGVYNMENKDTSAD